MTGNAKDLPALEVLLNTPNIMSLIRQFSRSETVTALRNSLAELRSDIVAGKQTVLPEFDSSEFSQAIAEQIKADRTPSLRTVINATGVIIHTNLGRSPMASNAIQAMQDVAIAPSNLEFDLATGKRGSRHSHIERLICHLTGAQAAVVVNNCAAAVLLSLVATSAGKSVVASRGELIEIGGSYRLPDVIVQSGAVLREVGTTNKTRLSDYEAAIDETTAVLLKSHTSNFRIVGFTSSPKRQDLAKLADEKEVMLIEDLGSGVLIDLSPFGLGDEPVVADIISSGVDLVMFSGDKLLGGPQAGIIAGKRHLIAQLKSHPLMRAVRIDKVSLAGLEATLRLYLPPHDPLKEIPVLAMLSAPLAEIAARGANLARELKEAGISNVSVEEAIAQVGAGALPERGLPSVAVSCEIDGISADQLTAHLRAAKTPVIGRIKRGRVLLDMRTIRDSDVPAIVAAFQAVIA